MCQNNSVSPMMGIKEVIKTAGAEATAYRDCTVESIVELTDLAAASKTSIEFPLSTITTATQYGTPINAEALFSAVQHSLKVAIVKVDLAGKPLLASAKWESPDFTQFATTATPNGLNEAEQMKQLWMSMLEYSAEGKSIAKFETSGMLNGSCSVDENTTGSVALRKYFHLDGAYTTNKAVLTLPTGFLSTKFVTADPTKTRIFVKLSICGYEMKGLCNPEKVRANLFQVPANCETACNLVKSSSTGTIPVFGLTA